LFEFEDEFKRVKNDVYKVKVTEKLLFIG